MESTTRKQEIYCNFCSTLINLQRQSNNIMYRYCFNRKFKQAFTQVELVK